MKVLNFSKFNKYLGVHYLSEVFCGFFILLAINNIIY